MPTRLKKAPRLGSAVASPASSKTVKSIRTKSLATAPSNVLKEKPAKKISKAKKPETSIPPSFSTTEIVTDKIAGSKLEKVSVKVIESLPSHSHADAPTKLSVEEKIVTQQPAVSTDISQEPASSADSKAGKEVSREDSHIIHIKPPIIVKDLATRMSIKPFQLISDLMQLKILVSINQPVEPDIARKLCEKHGFKLELERRGEHPIKPTDLPKEELKPVVKAPEAKNLVSRPPVVTIMGHVDHGKTSLLDAIRKANVAAGEAGGITQHIGAYSVLVHSSDKKASPKSITFLDTPGHEAFTAMRARGANITDIVILVVAANEGLMPQTIEAIHHARAANVPIIVALTKIDLEASQKMKDRVKKQLQEHDLASEDWGGKTITVEVSATKKIGIDQILEMILLQAEMMEIKAEQEALAEGNVIESQMESGRGATATVLVRKGTLKAGDSLTIGPYYGKVKGLIDDKGKMLKQVGPGMPAKIIGLSGVPAAGSPFYATVSEVDARVHSEREQEKLRSQKLESPKRLTLEDLLSVTGDNRKVLKIILKTDVQGSCEAIIQSISKLPQDKINVSVIHSAVGPITESDVLLATASKALIVGFQVKVDSSAAETAKLEGVQIQLFRIIYEIFDRVRELMAGLLDPEIKLTSLGMAEIKQVFSLSKGGAVAGCLVTQGRIDRKGRVRILRRKNVIFEGGISTLRRFQDDVSDVRTGLECGIRLEGFNDYQPGDTIEVYQIEKIAQKL